MAGKATSVYLTVADKTSHKTVLHKVFFKMAELNAFIKTEEFEKQYPLTQFYIVKETY
jgi:hypothetical protein